MFIIPDNKIMYKASSRNRAKGNEKQQSAHDNLVDDIERVLEATD